MYLNPRHADMPLVPQRNRYPGQLRIRSAGIDKNSAVFGFWPSLLQVSEESFAYRRCQWIDS
jgi:hypothetical protein